ncbi:hypothetical protein [Nonomuraea zeae]|uniref:hypothetical protein n=1 Tax=Nonomuraea zeae TaxID=1642303 RepID=UPI00361DF58C
MYVCGPCATINPDEPAITILPISNDLEVPFGDQSIATCPSHYEPTLRATIMLTRAAGGDDTQLQDMLAAHLEEGDAGSGPELEEPAEELQEEGEPEEVEESRAHSRSLEEVEEELADLGDEEDEGPDYYEALKNHAWNYAVDWSTTGKEMLRKWMKGKGLSDRGRVAPETQTEFALQHVANGALGTLLNPRAHQKFVRAYEKVSA